MNMRNLLAILFITLGLPACGGGGSAMENVSALADNTLVMGRPSSQILIIAHRGASGYLPEHTLGGYELAIRMGADFIEPDLQITKDGELIAMHDSTLDRTTNIATLFSKRNGAYRVTDFTLAEIKTLTVVPTGTGKTAYPGFVPSAIEPWRVPTFDEVLHLARQFTTLKGEVVGIYPEAKQVSTLMETAILSSLARHNYSGQSKLFIQSFSDTTLRSMRGKQISNNNKLAQILLGSVAIAPDSSARLAVGTGAATKLLTLQEIATFADGVGVEIGIPAYPVTKRFIDQAHAVGLTVHGWTFSKANPTGAANEYREHLDLGIDGIISNYTDLAVNARTSFQLNK